ncbi:MAG TPA: hypothetical protein VGL60_03375, partial [Acidimicrobiales bacterium]
ELLGRSAATGAATLVGLDFSFGYPAGFAEVVDPRPRRGPGESVGPGAQVGPPWRRTWRVLGDLVDDRPDNENNRFAVANELNRRSGTRLFWGRPASARYDDLRWLPTTDVVPPGLAPNPCAALRRCERAAGPGICSNFQLFGGVTVGGQVLTGIPWLARLLAALPGAVVWPLQTGFVADPLAGAPPGRRAGGAARVVFVELWPSLFGPPDPRGSVRDEGQVLTALGACARQDAAGWAAWFDPVSPGGSSALPARVVAQVSARMSAQAVVRHAGRHAEVPAPVLDEEGWILGVPLAPG